MTEGEERVELLRRDAAICAAYVARTSGVRALAKVYRLSRQRVEQILKKGGVWAPHAKTDRTEFLGVAVSKGDKLVLRKEARRRGISVSALTSEMIRERLAVPEAQK